VEDGLPMPLDRVGCYQQIGGYKSGTRLVVGRPAERRHLEHLCPYYTDVVSR